MNIIKRSKSRLKKQKKLFSFSNSFLNRFKKQSKLKKLKKNILTFHKKINRSKFLSNPAFTRIVIVCFFLGLNIVLFPYFLATTRIQLPKEVINFLDERGVIDKSKYKFEYVPPQLADKEVKPSLKPELILEKLNEERTMRDLEPLEYDDRLATAAADLLAESEKLEFDLEDQSFIEQLRAALESAGYNYSHVSHNMVIGPLLEDAVIDAWLSDEQQLEALFQQDFKEIGLATTFIEMDSEGTFGVVVQVLGTELSESQQATANQNSNPLENQAVNPASIQDKAKDFPVVSNQEVFDALNSYRESHGVPKLATNDELCIYAQKRVADLVANNGLDNHAGFKADFASSATVPEIIRQYSGSKIAENLAYQNCRNMQTGDGFIAETGTAIIEWCFDSSTAGHKEAQLSREFTHACVDSAYGMYVVIFGDG